MQPVKPALTAFWRRFAALTAAVWAGLFLPAESWLSRQVERLGLAALILAGLFQWGDLLNWGRVPFDLADWYDITAPRLRYLQEAIRLGVLPLHVSVAAGMKGATDRFLAVPDLILSPQVLLLRLLDPGTFALVNVLLLYLAGCAGLLLLRRRWRLSLAAFAPLFVLFNFNGHITAHLAVGHLTWGGYFLLPFFVERVLSLLEHGGGRRWAAFTALLLTAIFWQGAFHPFVWCLLLLGLLGLGSPAARWPAWGAAVLAVALNLVRVLPAALVAADLKIGFSSGFTSVGELLGGLVRLVPPARALENLTPLNPQVAWWEFDHYLGWLGLVFVLGGAWAAWRRRELRPLLAALAVLAALSVGRLYRVVFVLGVPLLSGERVTSRFLIVPLLFLMTLAAAGLQRRWQACPPAGAERLAALLGFLLLTGDLEQHRLLWKVTQLGSLFAPQSGLAALHPANHADAVYFSVLGVGLALSLAALGVTVWLLRRRPPCTPQ